VFKELCRVCKTNAQNKRGALQSGGRLVQNLLRGAPPGTGGYQLPGLVVLTVVLAVCFVVALPGANVMVGFSDWAVCSKPAQLYPSPAKAEVEAANRPMAARDMIFLIAAFLRLKYPIRET
jgi:hypothetical protein